MSQPEPIVSAAPPPSLGLGLRALSEADAGWIVRACSDPEIQRWTRVPPAYSEADAHEFIRDLSGSVEVWAIVDSATGEGLGTVAIHRIIDDEAALGYWVAPWARRRGVATWATLAVCQRSRAAGALWASLDIADANVASRGVAGRAGFLAGATPPGLMVPDGPAMSPATRFTTALHET